MAIMPVINEMVIAQAPEGRRVSLVTIATRKQDLTKGSFIQQVVVDFIEL